MSQHENDDKDKEVKKKTKQLQLLIEKYNKELDKVRDVCQHKDIDVKLTFDENGASKGLRTFCKSCDKIIGYPTKAQQDKFYGI